MNMNQNPRLSLWFRRVAGASALFALCVVVFGAFVRLSDAGLGCPDWPGCYGHFGVPESQEHIQRAEQSFPERPVDTTKAWIEMAHRYIASLLGVMIIGLVVMAWRGRREGLPLRVSVALLALVIFQGMLGMWTVTLLLKPAVVTAHLIGGMATLSMLFWLWLTQRPAPQHPAPPGLRGLTVAALLVVAVQIILGGWTSTNYAALACTEFPTCHDGEVFPPMDLKEGFVIWRGIGQNYEYGVLEHPARTAIHTVHRLWAIAVTLVVGLLAALLLWRGQGGQRLLGLMVGGALVLQLLIGVSIVLLHLPLGLATMHNAGAALLLLSIVATLHTLWKAPRGRELA